MARGACGGGGAIYNRRCMSSDLFPLVCQVLAQTPGPSPSATAGGLGNALILWAIVCLATALVLFFVEIFIPSGGIIGVAAAVSLIAGIVLLFQVDTMLGLVGAIVCVAAVPFLGMMAARVWPHTPVARMLTLKNPRRSDIDESALDGQMEGRPDGVSPTAHDAMLKARSLVGVEGRAVTDLRPVGSCVIEGKRLECLAEGGMILSGARVRVMSADGMQVKVREG